MRKIQVGDLVKVRRATCGIALGGLCLVQELNVNSSLGLYRIKPLNGICRYRNAFGRLPGAFASEYEIELVASTNQESIEFSAKTNLPITTISNGEIDHEKTSQVS